MTTRTLVVLAVAALAAGGCEKKPKKGQRGKGAAPISAKITDRSTAADKRGEPSRRPKRQCPPVKPEVGDPVDPSLPNVKEILPKRTLTVKVMKKLVVREKPSAESENLGEIKRYSRLPLSGYLSGRDGCRKYWMRVMPRGWVCGDFLQPDRREALMRSQPIVPKGDILPGKYGWIRRGGANQYPNEAAAAADKPYEKRLKGGDIIRRLKHEIIGGVGFWRTSKKFLVKVSRIFGHKPSKFVGIDLRKEDMMLPVAIVRAKTRGAAVYDKPGGKVVERVPHHSKWEILETKRVGVTKYYRIGKNRWVLARRVISAWPSKPPPGTKPCEKWIEINVSMQSITAWEGTEPVYASMVSSGDKRHPTKYGIFRLWWKKAQADMSSSRAVAERYRVDDVPWSQFFYLGQALHGAYWHSDWGNRRSHGCINLSAQDARWLYRWTAPHVPPGWESRRANEKYPGTLVRVVHKAGHEVPFRRYARKLVDPSIVKRLDEARKQRLQKRWLRERGAK